MLRKCLTVNEPINIYLYTILDIMNSYVYNIYIIKYIFD